MRRGAKQATPQLRVIGGQWRGRKLQFPDRPGLRPTGDRIRETLFNWLGPHLHNAKCLDLFAGSGALGIEALSRGAAHCDFVDADREAANTVGHHLNTLNATDSSSVSCDMAERYLRQTEDKWDIVFIDPPFDARLGMSTLTLLASSDRLAEASRVYFETSRSQPEPVPEGCYDVLREKTTGDVCYRLLSPR
jgi:16S rRNA (guanine966-N2)-methyltransferase